MKLHRLVLTNYRGITHREIDFPDRGLVVVSGANEIGKSSMIEALDLLFDAKDRSTKKEVKQVKPTHADVGAQITAEISTGPYRFIYHKTFHKKCETRLTVLAPRREQLSGDEAHDRVLQLLAETVDMDLWRAQRVLQAAPAGAVDLSGSDALARALDVAAGEAAQLSGTEPLLIERIEAEYLRYFTATGRPTGEWANANRRLRDADDDVARCAAAVGEVDDAVHRHAALTDELALLAAEREQAGQQLAVARQAADTVAELTRRLKEAEVVAGAAVATHAASVTALHERRRLRAEIDERLGAIVELHATVATSEADEALAGEVQEAAEFAADQARGSVQAAHCAAETARRTVERLSDRAEAARLATRVDRIDAAAGQLVTVQGELDGIVLTDASMRAIEEAAAAVERAAGQVRLASARIELVAAADVEVRVAGQTVTLGAGAVWSTHATAPTDIDLPGLLTARVVPGIPATETQAELDGAHEVLASALRAAQVDDAAAARALDARRRELAATRDRLRATAEALIADDDVVLLRARLVELRAAQSAGADGEPSAEAGDVGSARAELDAAVVRHQQAVASSETHRKAATVAAKRLGDTSTQASVAREKLSAAAAELAVARGRLTAQRASVGDDELAVKAEADGDQARHATGLVAALGGELARCAPDTVAARLDDATRREAWVRDRHSEAAEALREVAIQLRVYGTEGRKGHLDAAETEREQADAEYLRVHRRARAAQLLRSVMNRHRDATRQRYVDPFRAEVERLGRIVFGDTFEVEIDSDLRILSRSLGGHTVPYESLSGGAKEQLGIVARLAGAALVAKEDNVPVLIDDALGFTDPDRLTRMGAVFDVIGGDGQVIVLTCTPQRYAGVGDAHHIELTA